MKAFTTLKRTGELKVSTVLKKIRKLFEDPKKMCRGHYALTTDGDGVSPKSRKAAQWCMLGAVDKFDTEYWETSFIYNTVTNRLREAIRKTIGRSMDIVCFNDSRYGYKTKMKVLDVAIELAEENKALCQ